MSIEAMKQALAALETCRIGSVSEWSVEDITPKNVTAAIAALRTAIQQAEAQQPAKGEPVLVQHRKPVEGWSGETIGYTAWRDGKGLDWWPHRELYDHPAPSAPADVVRDAERYRWLRDHDHWPAPFSSSQEPEPVRGHDLDAAIDAAMLAAKDASA